MDTEEHRLMRSSLAQAVSSAGPGGLRAAVTGFGWHDLLAEEPALAVSTLAELQGEQLTSTTLLDDIVLAAAGIGGPAQVVYPDLPHDDPSSVVDNRILAITGVAVAGDRPDVRERLVIPAHRSGDVVIVTLDHTLPEAKQAGLDPASGWRRVRLDLAMTTADILAGDAADATWSAMRAAGQRALAHELIALGRRMLADAVEHVSTREQFGRRLGSFQAVKHALADVRVWQECAELAAEAAWEDGLTESKLAWRRSWLDASCGRRRPTASRCSAEWDSPGSMSSTVTCAARWYSSPCSARPPGYVPRSAPTCAPTAFLALRCSRFAFLPRRPTVPSAVRGPARR